MSAQNPSDPPSNRDPSVSLRLAVGPFLNADKLTQPAPLLSHEELAQPALLGYAYMDLTKSKTFKFKFIPPNRGSWVLDLLRRDDNGAPRGFLIPSAVDVFVRMSDLRPGAASLLRTTPPDAPEHRWPSHLPPLDELLEPDSHRALAFPFDEFRDAVDTYAKELIEALGPLAYTTNWRANNSGLHDLAHSLSVLEARNTGVDYDATPWLRRQMETAAMNAARVALERQIDQTRLWLVAVYDKGQCHCTSSCFLRPAEHALPDKVFDICTHSPHAEWHPQRKRSGGLRLGWHLFKEDHFR